MSDLTKLVEKGKSKELQCTKAYIFILSKYRLKTQIVVDVFYYSYKT